MYEASQRVPLQGLDAVHVRRGNEPIQSALTASQRLDMITRAARKIEELLSVFEIGFAHDPHTSGTPMRVAKMFVDEIMRGRFTVPPEVTEFENVSSSGEIIITGPIRVTSTCAHHLLPIYGEAFIGVLPSATGNVVGLSKYDRIVSYFAARLQVQEELVSQIGKFIMDRTRPDGLAVRISAVHMCKTHRGVMSSHDSRMVTSEFFGTMVGHTTARAEFSRECLALSARK